MLKPANLEFLLKSDEDSLIRLTALWKFSQNWVFIICPIVIILPATFVPGPHFIEYLSWEVTPECCVVLKCKVSLCFRDFTCTFFFNVTELWKHHPAVLDFRWATWRRRPLHCGKKTDNRSKWTSTSALQRECWNWKLLRWECEKVKCEYPYICVYISVLFNHLWIHLHIWL